MCDLLENRADHKSVAALATRNEKQSNFDIFLSLYRWVKKCKWKGRKREASPRHSCEIANDCWGDYKCAEVVINVSHFSRFSHLREIRETFWVTTILIAMWDAFVIMIHELAGWGGRCGVRCEKRSGFSGSLFISRDCQLLIAADLNSIMNSAKCQTWGIIIRATGNGCANVDWMKKWCGGIITRCKHLRFLSGRNRCASHYRTATERQTAQFIRQTEDNIRPRSYLCINSAKSNNPDCIDD